MPPSPLPLLRAARRHFSAACSQAPSADVSAVLSFTRRCLCAFLFATFYQMLPPAASLQPCSSREDASTGDGFSRFAREAFFAFARGVAAQGTYLSGYQRAHRLQILRAKTLSTLSFTPCCRVPAAFTPFDSADERPPWHGRMPFSLRAATGAYVCRYTFLLLFLKIKRFFTRSLSMPRFIDDLPCCLCLSLRCLRAAARRFLLVYDLLLPFTFYAAAAY